MKSATLMLLGSLLLSGCSEAPQTRKVKMSWTGPMKTWCLGRHMIDLPADYTVTFQTILPGGVGYQGVGDVDEAAFREVVRKIEREPVQESFQKREATIVHPSQLAFMIPYNTIFPDGEEFRQGPDLLFHFDNHYFMSKGRTGAYEAGGWQKEQDNFAKGYPFQDYRALKPGEVPPANAFCSGWGYYPHEPALDQVFFLTLTSPDESVFIHFSTVYTSKERSSRRQDKEQFLKNMEGAADQVTFLRDNERRIDDIDGDEIALTAPRFLGVATVWPGYWWESAGKPKDVNFPALSVSLELGRQSGEFRDRKPTLSLEQTEALWERITGSIRRIPATPPASHAVAPATVPPPWWKFWA